MLVTTMLSCKAMNSPLLNMFKQNWKDPLSYVESIVAIHKHVEGQCWHNWKTAQTLELVQGWKVSCIGHMILG